MAATSCKNSCGFGRFRRDGDGQSRKLMVREKGSSPSNNRRWEEMDHDILVLILSKYRWYEWGYRNDFMICKSWLSAFLDVLFPLVDVIDLSFLDDMPGFVCGAKPKRFKTIWKTFYPHLKRNILNRSQNQYNKLILPNTLLHPLAYVDIARLLPSLKSLYLPASRKCNHCHSGTYRCFHDLCHNYMFQHLKMLEEAHCDISTIFQLAFYCKSIRSLTISAIPGCGYLLQDSRASVIANSFPLLDRLSISTLKVTLAGMTMILEGHKNLSYLDMRHVMFVPPELIRPPSFPLPPLDTPWPIEFFEKIAIVKTFLSCDSKNCSYCISIHKPL